MHQPVEVTPSSLRPKVLFEGERHALDRVAVPDGLEHGVGEPQDEKVLRHLLAEVVVDTVDVRLIEVLAEIVGELWDGGSAEGRKRCMSGVSQREVTAFFIRTCPRQALFWSTTIRTSAHERAYAAAVSPCCRNLTFRAES